MGEAADGIDAVARIEAEAPDVVFLDIQMPKRDGFGVIETVGIDRISRIVSDGNYPRFLTVDGEFLKRGGLADIEVRLDPEKFLRINRSDGSSFNA